MRANPHDFESGREVRFPLWKSVLFSVVGFFCTLLVIEGGSRFFISDAGPVVRREHEELIRVLGLPDMVGIFEYDPDLFWRLKPGLEEKRIAGTIGGYPLDFHVSTNDLGLRGGPIPAVKNERRILALGNSCTFGVGVDDRDTWPAQLEEILRKETGQDVLVINGSVPGYTAFQGKRFLERRGFELLPDLVILSYGFNDAATWSSRSDPETARSLAVGRWESNLRRSRAYTGLRRVLASAPEERGEAEAKPRLSRGEFCENLVEIAGMCEERGVPVLFLVWPYRAQAEMNHTGMLAYQGVVAGAGEAERIPVLNLVDPFIRAGGDLFVDNMHGNAEGCRVAAEAIASNISAVRAGAERRFFKTSN